MIKWCQLGKAGIVCPLHISNLLNLEVRGHTEELHKRGYLLASIGLHFRKVEADTLVQTVGLVGGGATLYWVTVVVPGGDNSRAASRPPSQRGLQHLRGLAI